LTIQEYIAMSIDVDGIKDVFGKWIGENESASIGWLFLTILRIVELNISSSQT
jgi:transposase-like protein